MSIPKDIMAKAEAVYAKLGRGNIADTEAIAAALLAERERCADACDQWLAMYGDRGDELKHTTPQEWANSAVTDIALVIREGR